ncbi:hypothetical protein [Glaciibacter psychrotolerans]|uniref:Uncharacterized protein n=1 Tax=Glaciibacter psychrotolerans TaxID=670054 RepID=A0A7Z0EBD1_9MICO|nr:hypothetical protein [Leifsonia psychrotolerans]NYJ18537.1 hypothetical protein [Leifsonia psychrotolerans]
MPEPISIVGIDTENVGHPRNDGTRGSGLYAVPVKLSRVLSAREAELLVHFWDHPTSWSTMHRPGIASVSGSTLFLDGTTMEEVRDIHVSTVRGAVAATNAEYGAEVTAQERARSAEDVRRAVHEAEVLKVAGEIRFD